MGHKRKQKSRKIKYATEAKLTKQAEIMPEADILSNTQSHSIETWITSVRASIILCIVGLAVFWTGLKNPFEGDDFSQIVNNPVIHSLANIKLFFEGSTFYGYSPQAITPLGGAYYRPLITTVYALIYSVFKLHNFYFHLFQLLIYVSSTILLFLILRKPFKPVIALVLSLIFLVHPLNSQIVYAIPNLQDALFFFFGILAFYLLFTLKSIKSLIAVVICLFLCMLSKETAICFMVMSLVYVFYWDRKRFLPFIGCLLLPTAAYLFLRIHAVGLDHAQDIAPIQSTNIVGRLMTIPAIILFYLSKLVFPWRLATAYYWTQTKFSIMRFLVPLIIDLLAVTFVIDQASEIRKKAGQEEFKIFVFFAIWTAIGILPYLQIIPIDGTVNEAWFYFSMAGVVGMVATCLTAYRAQTKYILIGGAVLVCLLGIRSSIRGFDYSNSYKLAFKNITASPDDYHDIANIGVFYSNQHNYPQAIKYLKRSISIQPIFYNYYDLGVDQSLNYQYAAAEKTYATALKQSPDYATYQHVVENACITSLLTGAQKQGEEICKAGIQRFSKDVTLWTYLALLDEKFGDHDEALINLHAAQSYGSVASQFVTDIEDNQPIKINFLFSGEDLTIPVKAS